MLQGGKRRLQPGRRLKLIPQCKLGSGPKHSDFWPPTSIQRRDEASNAGGTLTKRTIITLLITAAAVSLLAQTKSTGTQEILKLEDEFGRAMIKNDPEAIGRLLADDWIIIDPDGGIIDRARFLAVIRSGTLSHEVMDSRDVRVRIYGNSAAVTALTTTTGKSSTPKNGQPIYG